MNHKKLTYAISLIVGALIFGFIFWYLGPESFGIFFKQAQPIYFIPYAIFIIGSMLAMAWKLQYILHVYKQKVPFFKVLKYTLACFAVSYVTPSARVGGEPLKTYMMHKDSGVPLKTGGAAVVIDKFVEFLGASVVAFIGFFLLFLVPGVSTKTKSILLILVIIGFLILFFVYYLTIKGKGPFTSLFKLLKFHRFKKFEKVNKLLKKIENRMKKFFTTYRKEFFISFLIYLLVVAFGFLEFYFLLLSMGVDASLLMIVLAHVVLGITNFIPVPAGLGFQEAGHSGLFGIMKQGGKMGFIFSLIIRVRNLIITGIGFIIIAHFGSHEAIKNYNKTKTIKKKV